MLSLGLQPVAIGTTGGTLPSWEKSAITGTPAVLSGLIDTAAMAAAKPDLIIATGDVDDATYDKLDGDRADHHPPGRTPRRRGPGRTS